MIPILLISNNKKTLDEYLNINFKKNANLFFEVIPSTKEYSIEDIKGLIKETKVFHPKIRIYFLANFHLSSIPAQNSFLKLLEEGFVRMIEDGYLKVLDGVTTMEEVLRVAET